MRGKTFSSKIVILATTFIVFSNSIQAQRTVPAAYSGILPKNYVRTWDVVKPITDPNTLTITTGLQTARISTAYFDGLGRSLQTVIKEGSLESLTGTKKDMVAPVEYDQFGREPFKYLPTVSTTADGLFKLDPFQQQATFMTSQYGSQTETYFYSQTNFEASPLNRTEKSMAPGNNWVGSSRGVEMKYWINTASDDVKKWTVTDVANTFGTYTMAGAYPAGELFKNVTADEHTKQVIEFKDKEGKVILKKVQLTATADAGVGSGYSGWLCTYYIYDDLNNLRAVIQPQAVKQMSDAVNWDLSPYLAEQCFRYEYDERNRMVIKKVPGAGEVWMVYDGRDRLVLTQDANLRTAGKWMYTLYDNDLNRPTATGLWTNANDRVYHKGFATTSTAYPNLSGQTFEELTKTFYDDYTWLAANGNPFPSSNYINSYDAYFQTASNINWPYAQANAQTAQLKGMATGSKIKVLGTPTYLYTISFYDEKGRVIQVQSKNITGGTDIATTQYTWAGQPLVMIQKQEKQGTNAQTSVVVTQMTYDDLGRVTKTEKKLSNTLVNSNAMPAYKTIAENEYDKLGQLKKKKLAPAFNSNAGLETLNYDYNIRGWMLGMNRDYLVAQGQSGTNRFGFELGYDKLTSNSGRSYTAAQYNGNITGMVWKSDGDDVKRKYDFSYDAANRLMKGLFEQDNGTTTWNNTTMNYSMQMGNGADPLSAYDANGNIKAMTQYGWKMGTPTTTPIDNLSYNYMTNSNKLLNVIDANNIPDTKLGDFRTSLLHPNQGKNTATVDYTYDANGNLKKDLNKDIGTAAAEDIIYNHLNLPQSITVRTTGGAVKGTITYTYDAAGNKLKKEVAETGQPLKTTLYPGGAVYENDVLQFLGHEEGRIRYKPVAGAIPASLQYDYMLKDHLGNVRMLLTEEQQQDVYPAATLENVTYNGGTAISVEDDYYSVTAANVVNQSAATSIPVYQNNNGNPPYNNNPYSNYTANSAKLYQLNATTNTITNKTGLGIVLKVMAGDNVNIFGKSYHKRPSGSGYTNTVNNIGVTELINAFAGNSLISSKAVTGSQITGQAGFPTLLSGLIGNQPAQTGGQPRAAINWIVFDEQFKYVSGGFDMVGNAGSSTAGTFKNHNLSTIPTISIPKNGYIYVYCSNESKYNVFFDNLQIIHNRGPILETTDYYPFGLAMAGISSKALAFGKPENKEQTFQGQRFDDDLGLNWVQFKWRNHDPQIGRFIEIDPLSEKYVYNSTYAFSENKVIAHVEIEGLEAARADEKWQAVLHLKTAIITKQTKEEAIKAAKESGLPGGEDGLQDAFRHAYWTARTAQMLGKKEALRFPNLHETGSPQNDPEDAEYNPLSVEMDLHNNEVGANLGVEYSMSSRDDLKKVVMNAVIEGKLKIVKMTSVNINGEGLEPIMVEVPVDKNGKAVLNGDNTKKVLIPSSVPNQKVKVVEKEYGNQ